MNAGVQDLFRKRKIPSQVACGMRGGKGHLLVIPRRHYADFFDSTKEERDAIFSLIWEGKRMLDAQSPSYTPPST